MAKRRKRSKPNKNRVQRNITSIAKPKKRLLKEPLLTEIEDNRRFSPEIGVRYETKKASRAHTMLARRTRRSIHYKSLQNRQIFTRPEQTITCIRRNRRRKTLFAKQKIGKGKSGPKFRRLTESSKIRC